MCGGPELEDGTGMGADMVGDQLRGSVDLSGTPLHGCAGYQEGALLTAVTGAAEALSDADSRVFEGSDLMVGTVTDVDMVDDQLHSSVDPSGTPLHGCVEYREEALLADFVDLGCTRVAPLHFDLPRLNLYHHCLN